MRAFDKGNWSDDVCPICKTKKEGKVVLIPIIGKQEGNNCQAKQFHLDCLDLWYDEEQNIIFQRCDRK